MAVNSLGALTIDLVANTAGFERGMNQAERALASATKEAKYQAAALDKLIGQIDPTVAAYSRLDKMEQQLKAHRDAGRLPTEDYQQYAAQIQATRDAISKTDAVMTKGGMSAKAYAAALRNVPAQFTDIAVSLQAGQSPLTVFLQQGGQLKDMFGGIGPAAKALGGYVVGLINPFTLAAAAAGVLALAYKQGSDEATAFSTALATTGNTAGTTTGQLASLAQQVSLSGGTVSKASAVLAQLAASTKIPKESFEAIAVSALAFEKATGQAAEETVKNFEKIAKDPTAEILKLNESMNFLTASTYEHIKALQEQGNTAAAADAANKAYESGLERTATSVQQNLGYIEKGWNGVKSAAKDAWDAVLNIGRESTVDQQLAALDQKLQDIRNRKTTPVLFEDNPDVGALGGGEDAVQAEKTQLLIKKAEDDRRAAAKGFAQQQQAQALADQLELDKLRKDTESNADKREKELGNYRLLVERRVKEARATGDNSLLISAQQQAKDIAAINDKYKDPAVKKTPAVRDDAGQKMLQTLREQGAALQAQEDSLDTQTGKYQTLGAQAQALAKFNQQIADIKSKDIQTADDKALLASQDLITAQLKKNVAIEQEVAARKQSYEEAQKLQAFQDNQSSKLSTAQDNLNSNLEGIGLGTKGRERLKEDLAIRKDYANQMDQLQKQHNTGAISDDLYKKESDSLQEALGERLVMQQDYYNQVDALNKDFFAGITEAWANYAEEATNYQQQAAEATSSILSSVTSSVADNIESLIKGQESIGDFFKNIALDMANAVIGALVKMAAQWLVYQAVQIVAGKTTQAAAATTLIANAEATSLQAGIAAFASTAAIPIVGPLAAPAAMGAALAITQPLVAGVSAAALSGMAHDGIDAVPETGTWLLQKGERVTTASTSAKLDKTLDNVANGTTRNSGATTVNLIEDASKAGQSQTREQDGQKFIDLWIAKLHSDDDVMDALTRKTGLKPVGR